MPSPVAVRQLGLSCFRNYTSAHLTLGSEPVVITGHNGAGKTNLLEAISLLAPGRGIRNARLQDITQDRSPVGWGIFAEVDGMLGHTTIGTGISTTQSGTEKRIVKLGGEPIRGQAALGEHLAVIALTPQMDQTFNEGATSRRSLLDKLTTTFSPDHIRHQTIYQQAKSERSTLLSRPNADTTWLTVLEERMAAQAVAIAADRQACLERLTESMTQLEPNRFPHAALSVEGTVEALLENESALQAEARFTEKLRQQRGEDRATGRTQIGPHRSDFRVTFMPKNRPAERCSTGEQKALLLSITLAAAHALTYSTGYTPLVLLDEVIAHLDEDRREALFNELHALDAQCWLTGTDATLFHGFKSNTRFLTVENSTILG